MWNWLRENYGWKAKRTEYVWLLVAAALLTVAVVWWMNGGQADYMNSIRERAG